MSIENTPDPGNHPAGPDGQGSPVLREGDFRAAFGRSRVAGIAFFVELVFLVGMVAFLEHRVRLRIMIQERSAIQVFRIVLFAAGAASVVLARIVNSRMLTQARKAPGRAARLGLLNRAALSSLAASMVPATIGFVLYLLAGQTRDFYILAFVSLLLLFFYFPRPAAWEAILEDRMPSCPR